MALPFQGEDTRGHILFEAGLCPLSKSPLTLDNRVHTTRGRTLRGKRGFGANIAKKRVSSAKGVHSKTCISGSQERWTLAFCMEATQSLKILYQHWVGS